MLGMLGRAPSLHNPQRSVGCAAAPHSATRLTRSLACRSCLQPLPWCIASDAIAIPAAQP